MGMVSYTLETLPPVSQEEIDRVSAMADEEIDCSDIPDLTTFSLHPRPIEDRNTDTTAKVTLTYTLDDGIRQGMEHTSI